MIACDTLFRVAQLASVRVSSDSPQAKKAPAKTAITFLLVHSSHKFNDEKHKSSN